MNADIFLMGFVAGVWATCLTIMTVLKIRSDWTEKKNEQKY